MLAIRSRRVSVPDRNQLFSLGLDDFGARLNGVLSPSRAIKSPEFLQGRDEQLTDVRQALAMKGRHVFIHGFRGVGKTSLAYTAAGLIQSSDRQPIYVQCSPEATLASLVHDIVKQAMPSDPTQVKAVVEKNASGGFGLGKFSLSAGMRSTVEQGRLPKPESVNDAVELLCFAMQHHSKRPVVIIDEFDHMPKAEHIQVDILIKKLAEVDDLPLKIIMCGVGETLENLFSAHLSTYRYFDTIKLDRLDGSACRAILIKAMEALDVAFDLSTGWRISRISDGFPHFVHLMCEKIFWAMHDDLDKIWLQRGFVELNHYHRGTSHAVQSANEELRKGYDEAVRKYSKNAEVILWAAADGWHELQRKASDMYSSYLRIMSDNGRDPEISGLPASDWRCRTLTVMRRPTRPRCPHGLTRTEARRATSMVPRPLTSRRGQLHFNRPRQRRGPESARVTPLLRHRLALCQNREKVLHCRYLIPI
jgi:energy-coupling factor transporter ATP-binding protein EcfA2